MPLKYERFQKRGAGNSGKGNNFFKMFTHLPLLVEEFLKEILFKKKWYILKEIFQEEIQSNASIHVTNILYMSYGAIILNLFPSLFENLMNNMNYFPRKKHTHM